MDALMHSKIRGVPQSDERGNWVFPERKQSLNENESDDKWATGLGRAGCNDRGATAASLGNRLGIAPRGCALRGRRRRRYARTSPDTTV